MTDKNPPTRRRSNLLPGRGRKPRTVVTQQEIAFCGFYVETGNVRAASVAAGFSPWWGYSLLKQLKIQAVLAEFEERKKVEGWRDAKATVEVTREFLDTQFIFRLVTMKTHERTGDLAVVKMFETGYKRTGDIQPTRVSMSQQQAQQQTIHSGTTAFQVYKAKWLREKEAKWDAKLQLEACESAVSRKPES